YALAFACAKRRASRRRRRCRARSASGQRDPAAKRAPPTEGGSYFAGLGLELRRSAPSSINPKLRSSSSAASIQVLAISSNTWRCRSDLVSPAHRKHSCANSRNSLGDAAMARSAWETGGSATGLSATGACVRAAAGDKGQDITVKTVPIALSGCPPRSHPEEPPPLLY